MSISVKRFEKDAAEPAHAGTILASGVLPDGLKAPFSHAYGYLENGNMMELHAHPAAEIYIVFSGKGFVVVGDERREVTAGDVIDIPSNEMHSMIAQENGSFLWAAFWWAPV